MGSRAVKGFCINDDLFRTCYLLMCLTHHHIIFNDLIQAVTASTSLYASFIMCV